MSDENVADVEPSVESAEAQQAPMEREASESAGQEQQALPGTGGAAMPTEKLLELQGVVTTLFLKLGAKVEATVRDEAEGVRCELRFLEGESILDAIPRPQLLEAAQHLINRIVNRDVEGGKRIALQVDSSGEAQSDPAMVEAARRLAAAAARMNRALTIVPINARDRKAIHVALAESELVKTRSEGEGLLRRLVIEAK